MTTLFEALYTSYINHGSFPVWSILIFKNCYTGVLNFIVTQSYHLSEQEVGKNSFRNSTETLKIILSLPCLIIKSSNIVFVEFRSERHFYRAKHIFNPNTMLCA